MRRFATPNSLHDSPKIRVDIIVVSKRTDAIDYALQLSSISIANRVLFRFSLFVTEKIGKTLNNRQATMDETGGDVPRCGV